MASTRPRVRPLLPVAFLALVLALTASPVPGATGAPGPGTSRGTASPSSPADRRVEGWQVRTPAQAGLRGRALVRGAEVAEAKRSTCFAVLRRGRLVRDWSWGVPRETPRPVFSVTKSVTSTLVGVAVRDGDLHLDDPVSTWVPEWRGTPSEAVTVRNLLAGDSGRFWSFASDYRDLLTAPDRTAYAVGLSQQHAPGSAWAYNNAAVAVLEVVLERATGTPVARYARTRLFSPLGMRRTTFVTDRTDSPTRLYGVRSTCLDVARLGELYLDGGRTGGRRLLDRAFVRQAVGRPSTPHNAAYGLLWWLNRPGPLRGVADPVDALGQPLRPVTGQLAPGAPEDLFAAVGAGGQVLLADPASRTLVVRLGAPAEAGAEPYSVADAAAVTSRARRAGAAAGSRRR